MGRFLSLSFSTIMARPQIDLMLPDGMTDPKKTFTSGAQTMDVLMIALRDAHVT
jgi:hypothetical protein